jgi:hypothetical protein
MENDDLSEKISRKMLSDTNFLNERLKRRKEYERFMWVILSFVMIYLTILAMMAKF